LYKAENEGKDFNMMHCFQKLKGCKKWDRVRLTLNDGKTGEEGPLATAPAVAGCPIGTKKAKAASNAGPSGTGFDVSINLFVDSMNANTKELYDRSDARWKEIKEVKERSWRLSGRGSKPPK
jgi:hypothetical protein